MRQTLGKANRTGWASSRGRGGASIWKQQLGRVLGAHSRVRHKQVPGVGHPYSGIDKLIQNFLSLFPFLDSGPLFFLLDNNLHILVFLSLRNVTPTSAFLKHQTSSLGFVRSQGSEGLNCISGQFCSPKTLHLLQVLVLKCWGGEGGAQSIPGDLWVVPEHYFSACPK